MASPEMTDSRRPASGCAGMLGVWLLILAASAPYANSEANAASEASTASVAGTMPGTVVSAAHMASSGAAARAVRFHAPIVHLRVSHVAMGWAPATAAGPEAAAPSTSRQEMGGAGGTYRISLSVDTTSIPSSSMERMRAPSWALRCMPHSAAVGGDFVVLSVSIPHMPGTHRHYHKAHVNHAIMCLRPAIQRVHTLP